MLQLATRHGDTLRRATPTEILRSAQRFSKRKFPYAHRLSTPQDVATFARWCLGPLTAPRVLFVMLGERNAVLRYYQVPSIGTPEYTLAQAVNLPLPPNETPRLWVIYAQPDELPEADPFGDELRDAIAANRRHVVHYLRIRADHLPAAFPTRDEAPEARLFVIEPGRVNWYRYATAQEVITIAQVLCARRLQRGECLAQPTNAAYPIELWVAPLREPSIGVMLLDRVGGFLEYLHVCSGDLGQVLQHCDTLTTFIKEWQASIVILVCELSGRWVAPTDAELRTLGNVVNVLTRLMIKPEAYAVVGTDGVKIYHLRQPSELPALPARAQGRG